MTRWLRILGLLLLVAVGLGAAGTGPLSWADATEGDLRVDYERFARRGAPWVLEVTASASDGGTFEVTIDRVFHSAQQLTTVLPEPSGVTVSGDVITYTFETGTSTGPPAVEFWFTADALWRQHATVGLGPSGPRVPFDQFVYP